MPPDVAFLCFIAAHTAIFHTVVPDHWLPFVMAGRAQRWSVRRLLWITGLSAAIHVSLSLALGLVAVIFGLKVAALSGSLMETAAGGVLILFGIGWVLWARIRKGTGHGHAHPGEDADQGRWKADKSGVYLAAAMGLNPCVLAFPILFAASSRGIPAAIAVAAAFAFFTIVSMVVVTYVAWCGTVRLRTAFFDRHGDLLTGVVLVLVGAYILMWG